MQIDRNISKYKISLGAKVRDLIHHFQSRGITLAVVCDKYDRVHGVISNGDFLRFLDDQGEEALRQDIGQLLNPHFLWHQHRNDPSELTTLLAKVEYVPILATDKTLVGVASRGRESSLLNINGQTVSWNEKCFIIAEIGNNHNGSVEHGKQLIQMAKEAGADCVKFQMRDLTQLYFDKSSDQKNLKNLNTEYTLDLLTKFNLKPLQLFELFDYAKELDLVPFCSPWDSNSLNQLVEYGMTAIKLSSADLTNHPLILESVRAGLNLVLSTGMSSDSEINDTLKLLQNENASFALLHCNSTYPTPFKDVHLKYLSTLKEKGRCIVGYSGHERGFAVPIAAVAMGAKIIEKHFTDDRSQEGVDHKVSLLPEEFSQMVQAIRNIEVAMGDVGERQISQGEMMNRSNLAKSLFASKDIAIGTKITKAMIYVSSPGHGLQPNSLKDLVGVTTSRKICEGDPFFDSDLKGVNLKPQIYSFKNPYGIPVRFHDFEEITKLFPDVNLLEFHLSYKDLNIDLKKYFNTPKPQELVVHCPELFENDHLLNLCSLDKNYRDQSLENLKKTIDSTNELSRYFPETRKPKIIINVGGFSEGARMTEDAKKKAYEILGESIRKVDLSEINLLPQTMPPFPWHFGGQGFHNLFIEKNEIEEFCREFDMQICLDVSHSWLSCQLLGTEFNDFLDQLMPFVSHMHLADAAGLDGEGIPLGQGNVDFNAVLKKMAQFKDVSFIPEVWQGHENGGFGFWEALNRLNQYQV